MGRSVLYAASIVAALLHPAAAQQAARDAVAAMQRGDFASAENTLRAEVQIHPGDAWTLSLLGVALDNQKRIPEAEPFHLRAVRLSPQSAQILNNYGTHLWGAGQYDKAESVFASALSAAPTYFLVLYNFGVMATFTGHYDRAREALNAALGQQPENVDVLYRLACVDQATRRWEAAVMRLAQAAKFDPRRADVQKLLAIATSELGALDDAAAAWDRYLKLEPNDETARRERAYTAAQMGKFEQAVPELEAYVARHPGDPQGHYELGQAQRTVDQATALAHFDRALSLDPKFTPAHLARGSLFYQQGKPESAVKDLEIAAAAQADNADTLDRLGQAYQSLDRTADAVRVLRKAAELAPEDSRILLHFGRALADAGLDAESKTVMDRFRALGPEKKKGVPAGLVEYMSLPPEQRRAGYRARVESAVREHPEDAASQLAWLKLMLEDRNPDRVAAAAQRIAALKPGAAVIAAAGHALLQANYYVLARDLLAQSGEVHLDLAVATFHATRAADALALMERIPATERDGEYHLAHAQILDAAGQTAEAAAALGQAIRASAEKPDLRLRAAAWLVRKGRQAEALESIEDSARALPGNREILLMKATTLEFAGKTADASRLLKEIQARWPAWPAAWVTDGILLDRHQHYADACRSLKTGAELGFRSPETDLYLTDCPAHKGGVSTAPALKNLFEGGLLSVRQP